ncbi:unnamed protein product [Mytilus edulis]|uniref:Endonuclease/exonuclease/phosphatase domain-containing protein n=1 Tax=Mytilus edulis TaxID=6550 RepID=A0A8S3RQY2_MYTED|nr:unnamed protein product [Mytilus edulis]
MTTATASAQQHPEAVPSRIHNVLNDDPLNQQPSRQCSQQPGDISSDQDRVAPQIVHSSFPFMHDQTRHVISASASEKPVHHTNCTTVRNNKGLTVGQSRGKEPPFAGDEPHRTATRSASSGGNPPNRENIRITTCNIEGVRSNTSFLQLLSEDSHIVCLQEHFLWDCQSNILHSILLDHDNHTRCHDTNEPLSGFKLPRGRAGVSILWPKQWNSQIQKLPDGNERVIAILISSDVDVCLINVYMPTMDKDSSYEYGECLDLIHNIATKYLNTHAIILSAIDSKPSNSIQNITKALLTASNKAVPTKPIKLKGPKWKASPRVKKIFKNCKQLYSKWKFEGKQADHPFRKQLKAEKKNLRSQQRKEHAEDRLNLYQQIMDNPSTDLFYKLINRNRSKPRTNSTGIDIEGELEFNPAIQRKAFAKYYEDLSIPKESKE